MKPFKIFVAEDDQWYSSFLVHHLEKNPDYSVEKITTGKGLLEKLHENPDVITLDYSFPDTTGAELLKRIKQECPSTQVIVVSGQEDVGTAIDLLKEGAYDYIVKDDDTPSRIWRALANIKENTELKKEVEVLREEVGKKYDFSTSIIGTSVGMKKVFSLMEKAIKSNITVSISGETGTGKEVVAKAIHYNSDRKKQPFVAINVSAIPRDLIESELFGHEKGAFTGAQARRIGKFEEAGDGTIFLDEMGEMDLNMQTKLLRVLQEKELVRVGGNNKVKLHCRIIAATHKNLLEEVKSGNFRQDLYYRLLGLPVELPALRERKEDIILLSKHFIKQFANENKFSEKTLSEESVKKLLRYSFPGNVRELKAVMDLAMVLSEENIIDENSISFPTEDPLNDITFVETSLRDYTHKIVRHFLEKYDNNVMKVADILDIGKSTIYRLLKEMEQ